MIPLAVNKATPHSPGTWQRHVLIPTPQVLQNLHTDAFWDANDVLLFKKVRKELRQLIRFWDESNGKQKRIVTRLTDSVVDR